MIAAHSCVSCPVMTTSPDFINFVPTVKRDGLTLQNEFVSQEKNTVRRRLDSSINRFHSYAQEKARVDYKRIRKPSKTKYSPPNNPHQI